MRIAFEFPDVENPSDVPGPRARIRFSIVLNGLSLTPSGFRVIVVITLRVMPPRSGGAFFATQDKDTARRASGHHAERDDYNRRTRNV